MRNILLLNYEFPPLGGGASPVSFEIAEKLSERGGFDIDAVTMGFEGLLAFERINERFAIHRVPCVRARKEICEPHEQLTYLFTAYWKCLELVRAKRYDICHCHFIVPTGVVALMLARAVGLEYVLTSHGSDVPGYNEDRFTKLHTITGPALRRICGGARAITTPSRYLGQLIRDNIDAGLGPKMKLVPNGLDKRKFEPREKERIVLATGRLLPRKGFQHLVEAVADRDIGYAVHICGDGPMMPQLERLRDRSKTEVVLHGWLDNTSDEYRRLLESAAIYALPSLKENASIALLEAMSAGCAVITTNVSGCPETVGPEGVLVEPADVADLRDKIDGLVEDPVRLEAVQGAMRRRVETVFDWSVVLDQYVSLLG